jgi:GT2 family glycosyltransferase
MATVLGISDFRLQHGEVKLKIGNRSGKGIRTGKRVRPNDSKGSDPFSGEKSTIERTPRLSVVIVNYRQWEGTASLVRQLRAATCTRRGAVEVMIVDNHSPAHALASRMRRWSGVSLRRWTRNRGFARAVNEGARLSRGQWLLLLNPDVSVPDYFVEGALALADSLTTQEPQAGIVGFQLRNNDGSRQLSCGPFPTLFRTLAGLLLPRARRKYRACRDLTRCQVSWATGCCLLIRQDCLRDLGGLDGDFFLYYEDVDLCRRARERGWSVWYEPALGVVHHRPLHGRNVPADLRLITRHALLNYACKHWPRWQSRFLAGVVRVESWLRRWWAWWRGDHSAASCFGEMGTLAAEMAHGRRAKARRRMLKIVRRAEKQQVVGRIFNPSARRTD